ncbi:hypothetical protein [Ekhidna sp. To15]|uniref:hypothetical protein n=1 Tax=Ekhidna sp. To15 TaxID=3395267 RepID=UPI003F51CD70
MNYKNLTPEMIQAFDDFLDLVDVHAFRKNLREIFFYYLIHEYEELPSDFGRFTEDMGFLFGLLERVEGH